MGGITELIECRQCKQSIPPDGRTIQVRVGWLKYPGWGHFEGSSFDFDADEDIGYFHEECFPPSV